MEPDMAKTPFSNSMDDGNYPDTGGSRNDDMSVTHDKQDAGPSSNGDDRPIQDNGTQGHNTYTMGATSGNKFPSIPDPHSSGDDDNNQFDYGLNESVEVSQKGNASVANYGFEGSAGGGNKKNMGD